MAETGRGRRGVRGHLLRCFMEGGRPLLAGPSREPRGLPMGSGGASGHLGHLSPDGQLHSSLNHRLVVC